MMVAVLLFFFNSCSKEPTTLRIALTNFPVNFDYSLAHDYFTGMVCTNIFDTLIYRDKDKLLPLLLENWFYVDDQEVVVEIKENIKFSDGTQLKADDVIASFRRHSELRMNNKLSIDKSEKNENVLHIKRDPSLQEGALIIALIRIPIYKESYIKNFETEFLQEYPMGTAEYFLFSSTPDKIVLKKNRFHRDIKTNKKSPDIVEFYLEPNLRYQYQMLRDNKVNFLYQLEYSDYNAANLNPNIKIIDRVSNYYIVMPLNTVDVVHPEINKPTNPLVDKRVRQAIAHVVDTKSYIEDNLSGKAHLLNIPAVRSAQYYPTDIAYYEYNPDLSKKLMREAGYADGFEMRMRSTKGVYSIWLSEFIQRCLAEINIKVIIDYFDGADIYDSLASSRPSSYVAVYIASTTNTEPLSYFVDMFLNYEPSQLYFRNYFKFMSPEIKELISKIKESKGEEEQLALLNRKLAEIVYDEVYILPFFQPFTFYAMHKNVTWNYKNEDLPLAKEFQVKR